MGAHCRPPNPPLGYLQTKMIGGGNWFLYNQEAVQAGKPMTATKMGVPLSSLET